MAQSNMRFIKTLLYQLKRQYGAKVTLYKTTLSDVDMTTGLRTTTRQVAIINLAIVLPDSLARKFEYGHAFVVANRPFTYGAQWDQGQRIVIIDGQDVPKDYTIEIENSAVFENTRYTVKKADRLDIGFGYMLTLIRSENNTPLQLLSYTTCSKLLFGQSASKL